MPATKLLLVDANVLIDYQKSGRLCVLTLASKHIGEVHIPVDVLKEVQGMTDSHCKRLRLKIIDTATLELQQAVSDVPKKLSDVDKVCLAVSKEKGYICVTNDKALRATCEEHKVETMRGLRPMVLLVKKKKLSARKAVAIAKKIQKQNKRIKEEVLKDFINDVKAVSHAPQPPPNQ